MPKAFVTSENRATFICPECKVPRQADVSRFIGVHRVRVRCPCGHVYTADLERRKRRRKPVNLPGAAIKKSAGDRNLMTVTDISRGGMKLRFQDPPAVRPGEAMEVVFRLNDPPRSLIRKNVEVLTVHEFEVGVKFLSIDAGDSSDKALGFYFFD